MSQSTYHQLVLALRELVANGHDANAPEIEIELKLSKENAGSIVIKDDGDGMSKPQFEKHFLSLGATTKRDGVRKNRFGRPIIGRFGIGFISAVPFAKEVVVETKTRADDVVRGVRVNCEQILRGTGPGGEREYEFEGWDRTPGQKDTEKFTRITLNGLTRQAFESIDSTMRGGWYEFRRGKRSSISNEDRQRFIIDWLSRVIPLGYEGVRLGSDARPPPKVLKDALSQLLPSDYKPPIVRVNGGQLVRRLADCEMIKPIHVTNKEQGWEARGVLWTPKESILPVFARGVAVRIGDMSIGEPEYLGLNTIGRVYGKLQHIAGEVHVTGLDQHLQLDRQQFYSTPETEEFKTRVRKEITSVEAELQRVAEVMQEFRNVKKTVDAGSDFSDLQPKVAPILEAPKRVRELSARAERAGIEVTRTNSKTLDVPKGERRLSIGQKFGEDLLRVKVRGRTYQATLVSDAKEISTAQLVEGILDAPRAEIHLPGSHVLIARDQWALANLRLFVAIKILVEEGKLTRTGAKSLLDTLTQTYR